MGCAKLVSALDNEGLPSLTGIHGIVNGRVLESNPDASEAAGQAVVAAVKRARARRRGVG